MLFSQQWFRVKHRLFIEAHKMCFKSSASMPRLEKLCQLNRFFFVISAAAIFSCVVKYLNRFQADPLAHAMAFEETTWKNKVASERDFSCLGFNLQSTIKCQLAEKTNFIFRCRLVGLQNTCRTVFTMNRVPFTSPEQLSNSFSYLISKSGTKYGVTCLQALNHLLIALVMKFDISWN